MADSYWIRNRGRSYGPYTMEKIRQLFARGQFSAAVQISEDGTSWQPANHYPELTSNQSQELLDLSSAESGTTTTEAGKEPDGQIDTAPTWHYIENGAPSSPISLETLQQLVTSCTILPDSLVWNESMPDWVPARNVPELLFPPRAEQPERVVQAQTVSIKSSAPLSQLAIASFVCAMIGISGITRAPVCGVLALIFGYISLNSRAMRNGTLRGRGLAIAGVAIGWCCIVFVAILVILALTFPQHLKELSGT